MATVVRLRIALADRPGALARVAAVVAQRGGNLLTVDVHHSGFVSAVDDMIVEFSDQCDLTALRNELTASGGETVICEPAAAEPVDIVVDAFRRATRLLSSRPAEPDDVLAANVAELCDSPVAWVSTAEEAVRWEAGRFALERNGAIALRTAGLPEGLASRLPGEVWLLALPDPDQLRGGRVVFVARPVAVEFTRTEVARIEALLTLHEQVDRLLSRHP